MKKIIKELLIKKGYKEVRFEECIYDMEDFETIVAYNYIAERYLDEILISVEVEENGFTIWESLDTDYNNEEWWLVEEIKIAQ